MEQRSDDWHAERAGKINASEAGALLGLCPYKSAKSARKEWIARNNGQRDRDISHLPDVKRGVELEGEILDRLEQLNDLVIEQDGGRVWRDIFRASADGFTDFSGPTVVEVKAPRQFFNLADRLDYQMQMLLQCHAYDATGAIFAQGVVEEMGRIAIRDEYISRQDLQNNIEREIGDDPIEVLGRLYDAMSSETPPEAADAPEGFEDASTYYLMQKQAYAAAKAALDEAKAALLAVTNNSAAVGERLQVIESTRQGSVNMKALSQAHPEIDLDQYRSAPTTYLQIREVKA